MEFNTFYVQVALEVIRIQLKYGMYGIARMQGQSSKDFHHWVWVENYSRKMATFMTNLLAGVEPIWDSKLIPERTYAEALKSQMDEVRFGLSLSSGKPEWPDSPCPLHVQGALEVIRSYSKPESFWQKVLAGEEVALLRQTRQRKAKPQALSELEAVAAASLGSMDTMTAAEALDRAAAIGTSQKISNPQLVAYATSDRYFTDKWQDKHPDGKAFRLLLHHPEWAKISWAIFIGEFCEDRWTVPEVFVVDGDLHAHDPIGYQPSFPLWNI